MLYYNPFIKSRGYRNSFLFLASILFYAFGEPIFVLMLIVSVLVNWLLGLAAKRWKDKHRKKVILLAAMYNLGLLFVFKYLSFILKNLNLLFGSDQILLELALPIGISFFSFQALSYVIDITRGKGEAQRNPLNTGLYIAVFPQLIAGPIVRYETVAKEINGRIECREDFVTGVTIFLYGLAKKVLLSNTLAPLADQAFASTGQLSVLMAWTGALAYTFQIYFDFSGYSDMAIGLGRMFGFHFLPNFNYPYCSSSISEFWRRWHISLGSWFRDYVYIPLGGSRVKVKRLIWNLFIVWILTGIWHGAEWTFLCWGLLYFVLLTVEKLGKYKNRMRLFGRLYTMFFVVIGWVLFRAENLNDAWLYLKAMFGFGGFGVSDAAAIQNIKSYAVFFIAAAVLSLPIFPMAEKKFGDTVWFGVLYTVGMTILFLITVAAVINSTYQPFIYFNF